MKKKEETFRVDDDAELSWCCGVVVVFLFCVHSCFTGKNRRSTPQKASANKETNTGYLWLLGRLHVLKRRVNRTFHQIRGHGQWHFRHILWTRHTDRCRTTNIVITQTWEN